MAAPTIDNRNRKVRKTFQHIKEITSRIGGLDTSLDAISSINTDHVSDSRTVTGGGITLPFLATIEIPGSGLEHWKLEEDAVTVADGVFVVDPLDFHAVTNPRKWKRVL